MGGLFKKVDPQRELPTTCKQALETVSPDIAQMIEGAARVGLPINSEGQKAALDFELANFTWLGLILAKKIETRTIAPLVTPSVTLALDHLKETERIAWLRKGARWLYDTNEEKSFVKLWDMARVPFDFPAEGASQTFIMQWIMRFFNNITDLAEIPERPLPANIRIEQVAKKAVGRLFPDFLQLPERDKKELQSSVGGPFEKQLTGRIH